MARVHTAGLMAQFIRVVGLTIKYQGKGTTLGLTAESISAVG